MKPVNYPLEMVQGATFQLLLTIQDANSNPLPLSNNYSAVMTIKTSYANATVYDTLSTTNGEITLGSNSGVYILNFPASRTANLNVQLMNNGSNPKNTYVYDFTLNNLSYNITYKLLYGNINVYGQV